MTAVLFDLDGTLADTPRAIAAILGRMVPQAPAHRLAGSVGRPIAQVFADLLDAPRASAQVRAAVTLFRETFAAEVVPGAAELVFPAIRTLLEALRDAGWPIAVVTSKSPAGAAEFLSAARLDHYFPVTVGYVPGVPGKPAPDQALAAAHALGVPPGECLAVGDSTDDVRMALAAGMRPVAVTYGVAAADELRAAGASQIAHSPEELAGLILPAGSLPPAVVPLTAEVSS
ncbi:MAG: HAD family hydrolase [Catenulispora sp.]|nr:HAD family hydrolase [Catenulispora sp.]